MDVRIETISAFWTSFDLAMILILSAAVCFTLIRLLIPLSYRTSLLDKPDSRKNHDGAVPLVGGVAIMLSVTFALVITGAMTEPSTWTLLTIGSILAILGLIDDYADISAVYRLAVQISVGFALCFIANLQILNVGNIFGNGYVLLGGLTSIVFTIMCSVGVFNSINMIDGIDGLAGTMVVLSAGALVGVSIYAGDYFSAGVLLSLVSATLVYLIFNLGLVGVSRKVFLGDAGSMFLGFVLLWFFIQLSQGQGAPMSPVAAGWIFGLPLVDTVSVIVGRLSSGKHPFVAGRDHIHHILLLRGYSSSTVLKILGIYHGVLVATGILGNAGLIAEPILFWGFVVLTVAHFLFLKKCALGGERNEPRPLR